MTYTLRFFFNEKRKGAVPMGWNVAVINGEQNCGYIHLLEPMAWNSTEHLKLVSSLPGTDDNARSFVGRSHNTRLRTNPIALVLMGNETHIAVFTTDDVGDYEAHSLVMVPHKSRSNAAGQPLFIAYVEAEQLLDVPVQMKRAA